MTALTYGVVYADSVTFPVKVEKRQLLVDVNFKDKDGKPITLVGKIDNGNNDNVGLTSDAASKLGLATGDDKAAGAVGGNTTVKPTTIPASNAGTISGSTVGTFNVSAQGGGFVASRFADPNVQVLLGHDFLNPDPAGKGAYQVNEAKGTMTVYNHEQALKLAALNFVTLSVAVAQGTFNPDTNGAAYAINSNVTFGSHTISSPFVISSGVDATLISSNLASMLGITPSGPSMDVSGAVNTFSVPSAQVTLGIFPGLASQAVEVGILPNDLNPTGINVLGSNFLGQFSEFQLNEAALTFSATAIPEPTTMLLVASGFLGLARSRVRTKRRRRGSRSDR